jgi:small multidrug resistance family-3 protein
VIGKAGYTIDTLSTKMDSTFTLPLDVHYNEVENINATDAHDNEDKSTQWITAFGVYLSIALFILSGLLEIGGGFFMWKAIREKKNPALWIPLGCISLCMYGVVASYQPIPSFGRVFATYGGFFIVMSYIWAAALDGFIPDAGDYIGAAVALAGVLVALFWPR